MIFKVYDIPTLINNGFITSDQDGHMRHPATAFCFRREMFKYLGTTFKVNDEPKICNGMGLSPFKYYNAHGWSFSEHVGDIIKEVQ